MFRIRLYMQNLATETRPATWLEGLFTFLGLGCIAAIGWLTFTLQLTDPNSSGLLSSRQLIPCVMDQDGYLNGEIYGALRKTLAWRGESMLCDGMNRPEGQGIRLVLSEQINPEVPGLVLVIGIADAVLGAPEQELEANVTIIDQVNGKFYSTQEQPRCWTRLTTQLRLTGTSEESWRLDGQLYCASALAAPVGPGSVTLDDIEFSSLMKPATE
jgi:hypothetical protein